MSITITQTAPGTNAAVPNIVGSRIKVTSVIMWCTTAGTVAFQDPGTGAQPTGTPPAPESGAIPVGTTPVILPYNPDGWYETTLGSATWGGGLNVVLGGSGAGLTAILTYEIH